MSSNPTYPTKGSLRALSIMAITVAGLASGPVFSQQLPDHFNEQRVVALVDQQPDAALLIQAGLALGYTLDDETSLGGLGLLMYGFTLPADVTPIQAIEALEEAVPSSTVGINHAYRLQDGDTASDPLSYANHLLHWDASACKAAGPVGIIDTGVDATAREFADTQVISKRFATGPAAASQHGTDVALVIADPSRLSDVTLYSADVVSVEEEVGTAARAETLIEALDWLASNKVHLVNISLAGPYNKLLDVAVQAAQMHGMILVTSVGNTGPDSAPLYPAGFEYSIAVTAVDADERIYPKAVHGAQVDVAAPGVDIFVPSGNGGHFVSGTSIAAPFVTARILAAPEWFAAQSASELRRLLSSSSRDLGSAGKDPLFGLGLLQGVQSCPVIQN